MKRTNPKTGSVIQGEATNRPVGRVGRRDYVAIQCVNCHTWSEFCLSNPTLCPHCGEIPVVEKAK